MRNDFSSKLDEFTSDLIGFCELDGSLLDTATAALLDADPEAAERVLGASDEVAGRRADCSRFAFELLALEAPVAKDLRQVVAGIYAVEHLNRMAMLAGHIATIARLRHPAHALPEEIAPRFAEMARIDAGLADRLREVIDAQDVELATALHHDDGKVDAIQKSLHCAATSTDWSHGPTAAVDTAMLARYYERFGDHTVSVGKGIVYLVTGTKPDFRQAERTDEMSVLD